MSDVHEAALAILKAITKTQTAFAPCYERAPEATLGLMEPYEVAAAYLSEHDTTEITEEWLKELGFKWNDKAAAFYFPHNRLFIVVRLNGQWWLEFNSTYGGKVGTYNNMKTQWQLRTVFRAFGIRRALEQPAPVEKE